MAESDSILQLGIEAARDGNREEARNLFRLLTRQDSSNAQAWLWLAGVAENRDERQAALEHVLELEPNNEMAVKGLNQLGVRPNVRPREEPSAPTMPSGIYTDPEPATVAPEPVAVVPPVTPDPARDRARYDVDDDDPYAALDTLSDAMAESPAAVRRSDADSDIDSLEDAADARAARETARSGRYARVDDDDDETVPARRSVSPLLLGIVIVALVLLFALLLWPLLRGRTTQVATTGAAATQTAAALSGTSVTTGGVAGNATPGADAGAGGDTTAVPGADATGAAGGAVVPGADATAAAGGAAVPGVDATAASGAAVPGADATTAAGGATAPGAAATAAPAQPAADLSGVTPALVAPNTPLESNGWLYDFNQPTYAAPLFGGLGNVQPQGQFAVVLAFIANRSGTAQALPADFFVIKDAQGRVYTPSVAASNAYVQRGVNADLALGDSIPADGLTRSVALVFDVQPDATNLVFFARSKTDQGWQVLSSLK